MRFDDTLETVLSGDVSTSFGKASAWRQLVDLIGRRRVPADMRALSLLKSIRGDVPVAVRVASVRALELAQPPAPLVMLCATDVIAVAAPVLQTARLTSGEWVELLPRLSAAGRTVLRARRDLPPGIDAALATFSSTDFVIEDGVSVAVADVVAPEAEPPEVEPVVEVPIEAVEIEPEAGLADAEIAQSEIIDWTAAVALSDDLRLAEDVPVADANQMVEAEGHAPADTPVTVIQIDWTEVVAARPAEPRPRLRIRADVERSETVAVDEAPEATVVDTGPAADMADASPEVSLSDAIAADNADAEAMPVPPTTPSTFISVGAALLGIPAVAAAVRGAANDAESEIDSAATQAVPQSETAPEPLIATPVAAESEAAHDGDMTGEETILADRDIVAAVSPVEPDTSAADAEPEGPFEIAEVVARIDEFYVRQQDRIGQAMPVARGEGFRFETDAQGVIRWVDGVSRAPLVGLSLDIAGNADGSRVDGVAAGAFRRRSGFADARLFVAGESDAGGEWRMSATAAFDPATGRFSGYRGIARRPRSDETAAPGASADQAAADTLRQLMHELRTPTNAIAGFAEMIEREMLGAAPAIYRERAATIRTHARALLAAIDDLDIAARIEASALSLTNGEVALRPVLSRIVDELTPLAQLRDAWVALPIDNLSVTGDPRAVERLLSRMLATLISAAGSGERIEVRLAADSDDAISIRFNRPAALAAYSEEAMFAIDDERDDGALLGTGFALRLIRNLSRELSGSFVIAADAFTVRLPGAVTKSLEVMR